MKNDRVLLIQPPLSYICMPSCALGRLKASLLYQNIPCDCAYLNLDLASILDKEPFSWMVTHSPVANTLMEVLYASELFPDYVTTDRFLRIVQRFYRGVELRSFMRLRRSVRQFNQQVLEKWRRRFPYSIVGLTANYHLMMSLYWGAALKRLHPNVQIVIGGQSCTGEMGHALGKTFPFLDWVVSGEGEEVLPEIVRIIRSGSEEVPASTGRRRAGTFIINSDPRRLLDLDDLPIPDYDDYFNSTSWRRIELLLDSPIKIPVEASRGCWWGKCTFCGERFRGAHSYRRMSDKRVVETMEDLARRHKRLSFFFVDCVYPVKVESLANALCRSRYDFDFYMPLRANISREQLKFLKQAGLRTGVVGIESFCDNILKKMKKGTTFIENLLFLKAARELNIDTGFNIISPFPGESRKDRLQNIKNIKKALHLMRGFDYWSSCELFYGSPMYCHPSEFGIKSIKPSRFYKYVLPKRYRFQPVYFWEFSLRQRRRHIVPEPIFLRGDYGSLEMNVGGDSFCLVRDRRMALGRWCDYIFTSPHCDILVACMSAKRREELPFPKSVIQDLVDLDLLAESEGIYLTLATRSV